MVLVARGIEQILRRIFGIYVINSGNCLQRSIERQILDRILQLTVIYLESLELVSTILGSAQHEIQNHIIGQIEFLSLCLRKVYINQTAYRTKLHLQLTDISIQSLRSSVYNNLEVQGIFTGFLVVVIGGLLTSTVFTLFIIPIIFVWIEKHRLRFSFRKKEGAASSVK